MNKSINQWINQWINPWINQWINIYIWIYVCKLTNATVHQEKKISPWLCNPISALIAHLMHK